jgi:hypothetical protein
MTEVSTFDLSLIYKGSDNLSLNVPPIVGDEVTVMFKATEPFGIVSRGLVPWVIAIQTLLAIVTRAK